MIILSTRRKGLIIIYYTLFMFMTIKKQKVAVAMSGGVDSSVTAHLLKKAGYNVEGFFLRLKFPHCLLANWREAEGRAYLAAKILDIPLHVLDAGRDFQEKVWEPLWDNYLRGLTSNPCPACNPQIKFGLLYRKVRSLGFDYLATGHYVRLVKEKRVWKLKRGKDKTKDQSYFLYRLDKNILPYLSFPLGEYKKTEVKKIAQGIFPTRLYRVPESQGLCFAQGEDFRNFMKKVLPQKEGNIVDERNRVLGKHRGVWFYTEGQRSGIGDIKTDNKSIYVIRKITEDNKLVVTSSSDSLYSKSCFVNNLHWIEKPKNKNFKTKVQLRYGSKPISVETHCNASLQKCNIKLREPQRAVTPGQSAVFYNGDTVIGGGEIAERQIQKQNRKGIDAK